MEQQKLTEKLGEKVKKVSRVVTGVVDNVKNRVRNSMEHRVLKPNKETVAEWKREVDQFVVALQNKDARGLSELMKRRNPAPGQHPMSGDPTIIMHRVENGEMDDKALKLFAISLFLLREKPPWNSRKAVLKILKGQELDFSTLKDMQDQGETMHCWDVAAWVKELAAEYGIDGEIKTIEPMKEGSRINQLTRPLQHAYFATDDNRVVDPMHGWEHGGYYDDEGGYVAAYKADSTAEQLGLRRDQQKKTPLKSGDLRNESFELLSETDDFEGDPAEIAKAVLWSPLRRHKNGALWNVFSSEESDFVLKTARDHKLDIGTEYFRRQKVKEFPRVVEYLGKDFILPHAAFEVGKDVDLCVLQKKLDLKEWQIIKTDNISSVLNSRGEYSRIFAANGEVIKDFVVRVERLYEEKGLMADFMGDNLAFRLVDGRLEIKLMDMDCFVKGRYLDKKRIVSCQDFLRKLKEIAG